MTVAGSAGDHDSRGFTDDRNDGGSPAGRIISRIEQLAPAIGVETGRLRNWCAAFAGMVALEIAEASGSRAQLESLIALA